MATVRFARERGLRVAIRVAGFKTRDSYDAAMTEGMHEI